VVSDTKKGSVIIACRLEHSYQEGIASHSFVL